MKKILKNKFIKVFLYLAIFVIVFLLTNLFIGWLTYDYNWLYKVDRASIALFTLLNLYIDLSILYTILINE